MTFEMMLPVGDDVLVSSGCLYLRKLSSLSIVYFSIVQGPQGECLLCSAGVLNSVPATTAITVTDERICRSSSKQCHDRANTL